MNAQRSRRRFVAAAAISLFLGLSAAANVVLAQNPRSLDVEAGFEVSTLRQNWSHAESTRFYNTPQGSQILPYRWFMLLEQPESQTPFRDADHIRRLGYLPRHPDPNTNPDGLPIGFAKDRSFADDGEPSLGFSCAACHTTRIDFDGKAYLIDGAPTLGDFASLQRRLVDAIQATLDDSAKFDRFAAAMSVTSPSARVQLRLSMEKYLKLRRAYNERNLPKGAQPEFGHGRVDAFGAIFNEVTARFLARPDNVRPANAPVSYPFIWDAPQHDSVQWNGAVPNTTLAIASPVVGTRHVGALGRNAGEVLGVFGSVDVNRPGFFTGSYPSTVDRENLIWLEESLERLWSPQWPSDFPALEPVAIARGREVYRQRCALCHGKTDAFDRDDPERSVKAKVTAVGTDETMWKNFLNRDVATGPLQGRARHLTSIFDRLRAKEPASMVLEHVVSRVLLGTSPNDVEFAAGVEPVSDADLAALDFSFSVPLQIETDQAIVQGNFAAVEFDEATGTAKLLAPPGEVTAFAKADPATPLRLSVEGAASFLGPESQEAFLPSVAASADFAPGDRIENAAGEPLTLLTIENARIAVGYKARPLNGIWATAPYLHNGSVPSLAALLQPASDRPRTFFVGNREFDPVNVGFISTSGPFEFDTSLDGNRNTGHEFGSDLPEVNRRNLLEYLKSL